MSLQGERRRTGVTGNGPNNALVVKRDTLTGIEPYQDEIDVTCSTQYGDKNATTIFF
jgi:hypothetical protein